MSLFTVQEEDFTDSLLLEECQKLSLATFGKGIFFFTCFSDISLPLRKIQRKRI